MNLQVRVTWPAWFWINSISDSIIHIFANLWYAIISDAEYESRIKWGVNYVDVCISSEKVFLSTFCDVVLAFNKASLEKSILQLRKNWVVFISRKTQLSLDENIKTFIQEHNIQIISIDIQDIYENIYLLSLFVYYFDIQPKVVEESLQEIFQKKWNDIFQSNKDIFTHTYSSLDFEKSIFRILPIWNTKSVSYGNKLLAYWAIDAKLEYYSAYPMTPASTILTEIIESKKVIYLQAEDEIAVINSALWASFTLSRSMVATSGGGFALMTEALSFAIQAELPIVVVLSQRAGPSTWTPTYHETGDISFALTPTFWDFHHIVLYPSSLEEMYYFSWLALNLADKYQSIVILLIDKQLSELSWTFEELQKVEVERWIVLNNPPWDYKRYEFCDTWISPRVPVWTLHGDFISSSYEHDEYWTTCEKSENKKQMTEKRFKKLENFFQKENILGFEIFNKTAPKIIITVSATSYTAKNFIWENNNYWLVIIHFLKPLDERLLSYLKEKEEIIFVENNYSWQLEKYITNELWLKYIPWLKISHLRKYDLYPFYKEDFNSLIWKKWEQD